MKRAQVVARWALAVGAVLWALVASPAIVLAQAPPTIALDLPGPWPDDLSAAVRADLRASLEERGLSLAADGSTPTDVLATIRITAPDLDSLAARIEIDDRVNRKRVERDVPLGREPPDTWSVVIAAAADELLRAAWLELTMADAPPPAIEPPPVLAEIARASIAPVGPVDGPFGITLGAAIEGYSEGAVLVGGDLTATWWPIDLLGLELGVAGRGMVPASSALGTLDGLAIGGDLGARVALLPRAGLARLELLAQLRALAVDLRPSAIPGATAQGGLDVVVVLRGGARAALALDGPVHLGLSLFVGAPLLGARATDDAGNTITAIAGVEIGGRIEVSLWP